MSDTNIDEKEYELMRKEILQYSEDFQSIRNMMYVATAAILAFSGAVSESVSQSLYYLYLLPLIVIIPSFLLYYNYNLAVMKAAIYLQVFRENDDKDIGYHWEGRQSKYADKYDKILKSDKTLSGWFGRNIRNLPYLFCAGACFIVYIYFGFQSFLSGVFPWRRVVIDAVILIICLFFTQLIFRKFWKVDPERIKKLWEEVRSEEDNLAI